MGVAAPFVRRLDPTLNPVNTGEPPPMGVESILLASLLLAIPITTRYVTAFQMRTLQDSLRRREMEIERMLVQLKALRQEERIIRRAVHQVREQHRWAGTRRQIVAGELARRRPRFAGPPEEPAFEPEVPPLWTPDGLRQQSPPDAGEGAPLSDSSGSPGLARRTAHASAG